MNKSKFVKTPLGKVETKPNRTPSSNATVSFAEIRSEIKKIADQGTVSIEKMKEHEQHLRFT